MIPLFFLALFAAWPTYGLSLAAWLALLVFNSYVDARLRGHGGGLRRAKPATEPNTRTLPATELSKRARPEIKSGKRQLPTWMSITGEKEVAFLQGVILSASSQGADRTYLENLFSRDKRLTEELLFLAVKMELDGASSLEQQTAAAEVALERWRSVRKVFL